MNQTDKTEMQMEMSEAQDGSAVVSLPEDVENPQAPIRDASGDTDDGEGGDSGDFDDGAPASGGVDPEREAIRAARREERQLKKQLTKAKLTESQQLINNLKRQNEQMQERLAVLEKRTAGSDMARLDKAIEDGHLRLQYAKMKIKESTELADGNGLAEAQEAWYEARRQVEALEALKKKAVSVENTQSVPRAVDPLLKRHASDWMARNDWYDPKGGDLDSQVVTKIDEALSAEGWDPKTADYWEELDNRLTKYLPHRYNARNDDRSSNVRRPRSVVTSSGRETTASRPGNEFVLSPERVRAIKEAGRWDNLDERKKMIRKYMDYDRMNSTRGN